MTNFETIDQLLYKIRSCPAIETSKHFAPVFKLFQYLTAKEKNESAEPFYQWAKENAEQEPLKFAYAEFCLGAARHLSDDHESGLRLLTSARKHFEEQNDSEGSGLCAVLTASIYRTFGNFDLALKTLWEGYGLLKQSGRYPVTLAACTNSMANINLEMHNYEEALQFFSATYEQSEKNEDYYFKIYALHGLGKVNTHLHRYEEAKDFLEKALQLSEAHQSFLAVGNSLTELANFYLRSGNLEKAEQLNKQALVIREQHHHTGAAVTNCIHLGDIYIKQSKWEEAKQILYKGLALAEQIKVKPKISQVHFLLSEIYLRTHEPEKSLHHYKLFHEIREQVEMEDSARKLADAKLIFEAEQTKKENIIIKKQKEEIQKKNIELQETIDELTLARVSKKAKALTLVVAIVLFIIDDFILGFMLHLLPTQNYFLSLGVKMAIIFSLSPINKAIETYLLKKVIKKKEHHFYEAGIPAT